MNFLRVGVAILEAFIAMSPRCLCSVAVKSFSSSSRSGASIDFAAFSWRLSCRSDRPSSICAFPTEAIPEPSHPQVAVGRDSSGSGRPQCRRLCPTNPLPTSPTTYSCPSCPLTPRARSNMKGLCSSFRRPKMEMPRKYSASRGFGVKPIHQRTSLSPERVRCPNRQSPLGRCIRKAAHPWETELQVHVKPSKLYPVDEHPHDGLINCKAP